MAFTLKQLEALIWVADLGSFRKAADRLNTTQPNISSRIAALETSLDLRLMERDSGSVRMTAEGERILAEARHVMRATEALREAAGRALTIEGTLRLGVTELIVHTWLRAYLRRLKEVYPNLTVELTVDLSRVLDAGLQNRAIDLALHNGPFDHLMAGEIPLGRHGFIWVAAPDLGPLGGPLSAGDLTAYPILTNARTAHPYPAIAAHFSDRRARLVPSSNLSACRHMALDRMGVAALPAAMVAADLTAGDLITLDYRWTPEPMAFFARYDTARAGAHVGKAALLAQETAQEFDAAQ